MGFNFPTSPTNGQRSNGYYYDSSIGAWRSEKTLGVPAGVTMAFAGATAPTGFLLCDGSSKNRADYPELFAVLGGVSSPYGLPSGTTFNLPDLRQRIPVGKNATGTFATIGSTGGVESVTLTAAQSGVPAHGHGVTDPGHNHTQTGHAHYVPNIVNTGSGSGAFAESWGGGSGNRGIYTDTQTPAIQSRVTGVTVNNSVAADASAAHTNLQPYITMNYIIKT